MRMAYSIAVPFTAGSAPGRPSEVGVVFSFAPPPNVLGAASNIFVAVPSSTCTSMPRAGSYVATASSYLMCVSSPASGARRCGFGRVVHRRTGPDRRAGGIGDQRLECGSHLVETGVLARRGQQLEAHGHPVRQARR